MCGLLGVLSDQVVFTLLQFSYSTERYKDIFVLLIYSGHDGNQGTANPTIHH